MAKNSAKSVEALVASKVSNWMKEYGLENEYKPESIDLAPDIDYALDAYKSKSGGKGGNRPDGKMLLVDEKKLDRYPVLLEYKGEKGKLVKLDNKGNVQNTTDKVEPNYKNIQTYAVNGAIHYANALLHYTDYKEVIAIGVTGWEDEVNGLQLELGVYHVSKDNYGNGQKIGEFSDLSFLRKENFSKFTEKLSELSLSEEDRALLKQIRESEIDTHLMQLNNDLYNEDGLGEDERVYLVAASIIANLGVPGEVKSLKIEDLHSLNEKGGRDGDIVIQKIKAFMELKQLPKDKEEIIINLLSPTILNTNINRPVNGMSQLKRVYKKIIDSLGIYYRIGLTTDFTGKLFNEMYGWLGFTEDKLNDVVITPTYVGKLLVKLARVNMNSYVWDFATGSAGLLVAAMNEMIADARKKLKSPDDMKLKEAKIKAEQLLGLEILPSVYMLAILNMILMGDGSSNILNKNSLNDFNGNYGFGNKEDKFPADAFVLNPPYSERGNGMVFVDKALTMMQKGYAAFIIQGSAGSGKAKEYNKRILERNTLLASIKMPMDLFLGKSSVQTYVYVLKVGEKHEKEDTVKFIDFSNDGYTRTNRKKARCNLRDTGSASLRYQEVVDLVRFGKERLNLLTESEYFEGHIDPLKGDDWNQSAPVDTRPRLADFKKTVADYLSWEVTELLKRQATSEEALGK